MADHLDAEIATADQLRVSTSITRVHSSVAFSLLDIGTLVLEVTITVVVVVVIMVLL